MNPKPFKVVESEERLGRMSSRMTLVMAMDCSDALLFAADREESTELGGKRSVSKIHQGHGENWVMGIATAGSGPVGDIAATRIIKNAKANKTFNSDPGAHIEKVMSEIYKQYIFPRNERRQAERGISLVIGIYDEVSGHRFLFKTFEEIVKPEPHYACAGVGADVAYYFLDRLQTDAVPATNEAKMLTAFILREAKSSVGGVGNESEFVTLHYSGQFKGFSGRTLINQVVDWREIPHLSKCLTPFWKNPPMLPSTSQKLDLEP